MKKNTLFALALSSIVAGSFIPVSVQAQLFSPMPDTPPIDMPVLPPDVSPWPDFPPENMPQPPSQPSPWPDFPSEDIPQPPSQPLPWDSP